MKYYAICILFILFLSYTSIAYKPCIQRRYNRTSFVCVCNSTYCDEIDEIKPLPKGQYLAFQSSANTLRFQKQTGFIKTSSTIRLVRQNDISVVLNFYSTGKLGNVILTINRKTQYQTIIGFGGSVTDTSNYLQIHLSNGSRANLLRSYFSKTGIEYNIIRVPIGGSDFSLRPYAYNMYPKDDMLLSNFSLEVEDLKYKIPIIKEARSLTTSELFLLGCSWGSPTWMKTNHLYGGAGQLIKKYFQTWADYHLKFLEEYDKHGIKFWGITPGNEPSHARVGYYDIMSVGWGMKEYINWVGNNFGPTIRNSKFSYLKFLLLDESKFVLPWAVDWIINDENASKYFDGIATHYYSDSYMPPSLMDDTHASIPDKIILLTEACYGTVSWMDKDIALGSWFRAEWYFGNILQNLNHWHSGWMDWNLCLDHEGGPTWSTNRVDSSVIVDIDNDEFLKQPMFYAIGHFSKFLPRGSIRVEVQLFSGDIQHVGFLRPDGGIVVIFYNPFPNRRHIVIHEEGIGYIEIDIFGHSFNTILYW